MTNDPVYSLAGKVTIVTGGAQGIGRGICIELARLGASVAVWDINEVGAAETVKIIESAGGRAIAYSVDISLQVDVDRVLKSVRDDLGNIGVLVNNAAVVEFVPFDQVSMQSFERLCQVNLIAPFMLAQRVICDMQDSQWGRIINIGSAAAQRGTPKLSHYAATKGGMMAFTKTLALELADSGITVNCISPCCIDTDMRQGSGGNFEAAVAAAPMKRAGQPVDIASAVAFLASDAAGYISGQTLGVNGALVLS